MSAVTTPSAHTQRVLARARANVRAIRWDRVTLAVIAAAAITALAIFLGGCSSSPPAPADPVTAADYRSVVIRARTNLRDHARPAFAAALASDAKHDQAWKDAQLDLLDDTLLLFDDALRPGEPKASPPAPNSPR